jgi:hypothetical protein
VISTPRILSRKNSVKGKERTSLFLGRKDSYKGKGKEIEIPTRESAEGWKSPLSESGSINV